MRDVTIYVVDDDDGIRDSLQALLECEGFSVVVFASGADFLGYARPDGPCCILLDVHLPGISGLQLLDGIRSESPTIPVIVMTGRPDPAVVRHVNRAGVTLLEKPFAAIELMRSIEEAVRGGLLH